MSEPRRSHSEPCQSRVGEAKKKKKKRDTRRTPESGESYPYRCPTRVRHRHDAKNGVSVQPSLELTCCSLLKRIEISSDQLKSLALLACWNLVEVKLDAPKLCRFNHYTRSVISLSSSNALNLSVATYGIISPDVP